MIRKLFTAVATIIVVGTLGMHQPAQAHDGGAVAAGAIGGLAVGMLIGSAAAHDNYYYQRAYHRPYCWWGHERYWDGWRWHWHRVRVCR